MSGMMEKVKAKVDNVMHKDKSHDDSSNGPHSSHTANTADPSVHNTSGTHTGSTGVAGEHHGSGVGTGLGSSGTHGEHHPSHATTGTTGLGSSTGTHGSTAYSDPSGPHNSGMMNKADPRVDSDRLGTAGNTAGAGGVGAGQYTESHGTTGTGLAGHSTTGAYPAGNTMGTSSGMTGHGTSDFHDTTGPHSSRMANQADPRVEGVGSTTAPTYNTTTASGGLGHSHNDPTGPHASHMANTADPRVGGIGNTYNDPTGPHASHAANTADPRVGGIGSTDAGLHGSNAGLHGSNAGLHGSNAGLHNSNAGLHGSNAGVTGTGEHLKTAPGEVSGSGHNNLSHRNDEDGGLPKALTEPQSHAEPHSSVRDGHVSGSDVHAHNAQHPHGKPSLKDKINPKVDADMDGKAGIMD